MKRVNIRSVKQATGELVELYLESGLTGGRVLCPQDLIPSAGQYLLAHDGSDSPLPAPVFNAGSVPGGFLIAPPIPANWGPGTLLSLHGPLGHGFTLPTKAQNIALAALGETIARLRPILSAALEWGASVVLASDLNLPDLPPEIEIQPVSILVEIIQWADYLAIDLPRESLPGLRKMLGLGEHANIKVEAQPDSSPASSRWVPSLNEVLVATHMSCGGVADCEVCAVKVRRGWKMACKDGPVFDLKELI